MKKKIFTNPLILPLGKDVYYHRNVTEIRI